MFRTTASTLADPWESGTGRLEYAAIIIFFFKRGMVWYKMYKSSWNYSVPKNGKNEK